MTITGRMLRVLLSRNVAAQLLDALPSYAEITVFGRLGANRDEENWKLMARDIPRPERRFTNLNTGTEVFKVEGFLENVSATEVWVYQERDNEPRLIIEIVEEHR